MTYNPYSTGKTIRTGLDFFVKGFDKKELSKIYYELSCSKSDEGLLMESPSFVDVDEFYNPGAILNVAIFEAITVQAYSRTQQKMAALQRSFNKYLGDSGISASTPLVGKPKTSGLFATVTVQIPFSDGQSVSVIFHSPDNNNKKITATDEIIAFRWLLNKKDITLFVAPEDGKDISLEELSKRVTQLVTKNSEKFQTTQKPILEQKAKLAGLKNDTKVAKETNDSLVGQLSELNTQSTQLDSDIENAKKQLSKLQDFNSNLQTQIDTLGAEKAANTGKSTGTDTTTGTAGTDQQKADDLEQYVGKLDTELVGRGFILVKTSEPVENWRGWNFDGVTEHQEPRILGVSFTQNDAGFKITATYSSIGSASKVLDSKIVNTKAEKGIPGAIKKVVKFVDSYMKLLSPAGTTTNAVNTETTTPVIDPIDARRTQAEKEKANLSIIEDAKPLSEMNLDELVYAAMRATGLGEDYNSFTMDEINRLIGSKAIPGLRASDVIDAGRVYRRLRSGEETQEAWDKYVAQLKAENRVYVEPTPTPTPSTFDDSSLDSLDFVISESPRPADVPESWVIFNAPRPIYGEKKWDGEFLNGRFYAALDTTDRDWAAKFIEENRMLRASVVVYMSQEELLKTAWALARRDNAEYIDDSTTDEDVRRSFYHDVESLKYGEFMSLIKGVAIDQPEPEIVEPQTETEPAVSSEPPEVQIANDILSGKYDASPLKDVMDMLDPVFELDEVIYGDLMARVDAYATELTRKKAA
jgi:hypothetical protein